MIFFKNVLWFCVDGISLLFKRLLMLLVRFYQIALSPLMANHCRFEPTCSRYALIALERHGPIKGSWLALTRIVRCRPGVLGGWDPVPDRPNRCACGHHHSDASVVERDESQSTESTSASTTHH